jgi:hypothetical protein
MVAATVVVSGLNLTGHGSSATSLRDPAATASVPSATKMATKQPLTPTAPASTPVPDQQMHAHPVALMSGTITYDEVQWFDGKAARRECRKDGLKTGLSDWCTSYYYKTANPRVRRLPMAKNMVIKVPRFRVEANRGSTLTTVTLSQLEKFVDTMDIVRLTIKNGEITEFDELFLG